MQHATICTEGWLLDLFHCQQLHLRLSHLIRSMAEAPASSPASCEAALLAWHTNCMAKSMHQLAWGTLDREDAGRPIHCLRALPPCPDRVTRMSQILLTLVHR